MCNFQYVLKSIAGPFYRRIDYVFLVSKVTSAQLCPV